MYLVKQIKLHPFFYHFYSLVKLIRFFQEKKAVKFELLSLESRKRLLVLLMCQKHL